MNPAKRGKFHRTRLSAFALLFTGLCLLGPVTALMAAERSRPALFLPEERQIIREFFHGRTSGLPPGLAKRGGDLPPGLQKHLRKKGTLPPGLQKRLEPLPRELESRLPRIPEAWQRVILGPHVILLDRRTARILDIIDNVIGLVTDQ